MPSKSNSGNQQTTKYRGNSGKLIQYVLNLQAQSLQSQNSQPIYGRTIDYKEIERVTGLPRFFQNKTGEKQTNNSFNNVCSRANKTLTNLHLRWECVQGVGYRILHPNEYAASAMKYINKAHGLVKCAEVVLDNTEVNKLKNAEKNEHAKVKKDVINIQGVITKSYTVNTTNNIQGKVVSSKGKSKGGNP